MRPPPDSGRISSPFQFLDDLLGGAGHHGGTVFVVVANRLYGGWYRGNDSGVSQIKPGINSRHARVTPVIRMFFYDFHCSISFVLIHTQDRQPHQNVMEVDRILFNG
jgi:hypothetical protein